MRHLLSDTILCTIRQWNFLSSGKHRKQHDKNHKNRYRNKKISNNQDPKKESKILTFFSFRDIMEKLLLSMKDVWLRDHL